MNIGLVYGDIRPETFNLKPPTGDNSSEVDGLLATHVFGNPCELTQMAESARSWDVPLIYDAAHAFGVKVDGQSVLNFGDMSILSFHATKIFHSIEGGAVVFKDSALLEAAKEMINFGFDGSGAVRSVGINAKMNELEAAMGLAMLDEVDEVLEAYRTRYEMYDDLLDGILIRQRIADNVEQNYSYFPICFADERSADYAIRELGNQGVTPRKYFSPSLDTVAVYGSSQSCEVSQDVASRIVCLPMYTDLPEEDVRKICRVVNQSLEV